MLRILSYLSTHQARFCVKKPRLTSDGRVPAPRDRALFDEADGQGHDVVVVAVGDFDGMDHAEYRPEDGGDPDGNKTDEDEHEDGADDGGGDVPDQPRYLGVEDVFADFVNAGVLVFPDEPEDEGGDDVEEGPSRKDGD